MTGALDGLRVLDLSRILAGPTCTQLLGDLGANVIKIENPKTGGDDTRAWGPPFVKTQKDEASDLSAYFNCANRNKRSVAIDMTTAEGRQQITELACSADILVENFKPDGLRKYDLHYEAIAEKNPSIIYCSISGFGQNGPNAHKPGYDLMAQGYGGIMSLTGDPNGEPMKVGVGIADVMCGMYASNGILAALHHRTKTGEGQHIDIGLVDAQIAWLINEGTNYLTSGELPIRRGNGHPNIAPYQVYATRDGHVIVACGNDRQFAKLVTFLGFSQLTSDPKFETNPARLQHRVALNKIIEPALMKLTVAQVVDGLESCGVPVGPVNTIDRVFDSEQVKFREMKIQMNQEVVGSPVPMIGNPLKLSRTPVSYRLAPPVFGQDTSEVLDTLSWS